MKTKWKMAVVVAMATGSLNMAGADIIWPADGDWTALMSGTDMYHDPSGDQTPASIDLVGTTDTYSAGYWALVEDGDIIGGTTNDAFMFRMRLRANGDGKNYAWQTLLDTDGDASDVEWIFQLVQSGNPSNRGVELIKTAVGGTTLGDINIGSNTAAWLGGMSLYSRWSAITGSTDFHVDLAIPWNEFSTITGVAEIGQIRTVLATSTSHANTGKDAPLGLALTDQVSDVLSETIPEPAVVSLLLGTGGGMVFFRRIFKRKKEDQPS
ncbi:MAG: hypothetical protein ABFR33_05660 [Verrucomicrobiota bacterium]